VVLFGVDEVTKAHHWCYVIDDIDPATAHFFLVGSFNIGGDYLGMDSIGHVYFLDHDYSPEEWEQGQGSVYLSHSLAAFMERLAQEGGRWWWLPGFEIEN
jgi:hypothetical protein